jgi:prepilin-type processing-associated H-X9-DG protein
MYANVSNDTFPNLDGVKGINQLDEEGFLDGVGIIFCPNVQRVISKDYRYEKPITDKNFDYLYRNGLTLDVEAPDKTPILWDKPNNHNKYGNVLFVDGHVKGYAGVNWMTSAGIPKEWIKKSNE